MKTFGFDMELIYDFGDGNEDVRVTGNIVPEQPATGPTWDCGGTPPEPAEIDDFRAYRMIDGKEVEVEDPDGVILAALEDTIYENAGDDL